MDMHLLQQIARGHVTETENLNVNAPGTMIAIVSVHALKSGMTGSVRIGSASGTDSEMSGKEIAPGMTAIGSGSENGPGSTAAAGPVMTGIGRGKGPHHAGRHHKSSRRCNYFDKLHEYSREAQLPACNRSCAVEPYNGSASTCTHPGAYSLAS